MRENIFNKIIIFICFVIFILLLIERNVVYDSVIYSLNLWVNKLIPVLFPFFIISDILINYNITDYIPKLFKNLCKDIFNITDNMLTILLLSIFSGFPSNARNTRLMYDKGLINDDEANHILIFSHFSNPIFVLITVGIFFLNNKKIGIILLISHYLSNIILGIIVRNRFIHNNNKIMISNKSINFGNIFILSIKKAIDTIILICGIMTVFLILSNMLINLFNFNIYNDMLIKGIFEITIGLESLASINLPIIYKAVISSCFLAFGGFSVHMQVISQITDTKINYIYFLMGRFLQMGISGIITYIIMII